MTVTPSGEVHVDRVFAATDAYHVVNPNLVDAQIEGGMIFGMTAMLYGEITIKNGAAVQGNFNDYRMVRHGRCAGNGDGTGAHRRHG